MPKTKKVKIEILTTSFGCNKCESVMAVIKKVMNTHKKVLQVKKIDIKENPEKCIMFGVMSTPAVIINGKLVFEGSINEKALIQKIEESQ